MPSNLSPRLNLPIWTLGQQHISKLFFTLLPFTQASRYLPHLLHRQRAINICAERTCISFTNTSYQ